MDAPTCEKHRADIQPHDPPPVIPLRSLLKDYMPLPPASPASDFYRALPGVYYDIPEVDYHALRTAPDGEPIVSKSKLWRLHEKSPRDVQKKEQMGHQFKDHFAVGSLMHQMILEPDKYRIVSDFSEPAPPTHTWYVMPEGKQRRGKDFEALVAEYGREQIVTAKDYNMALWIKEEVDHHSDIKALLSRPYESEVTIIARHEETGLLVKGRLDILFHDGNTGDIKTYYKEATYDNVKDEIDSRGYDAQGALYQWLLEQAGGKPQTHAMIFLSKSSPYLPGLYPLKPETIQKGWTRILHLLNTYAGCRDTGYWPGLKTAWI